MQANEQFAIISNAFAAAANAERATAMRQYMRNNFEFFGIPKPQRTEIEKPLQKLWQKSSDLDWCELVYLLWRAPQRELHYVALNLAQAKIKTLPTPAAETLCKWLATRNFWWDSIDVIAPHLLGNTLLPLSTSERKTFLDKWLNSSDFWQQRATLIFQLTYKEKTDTELLTRYILALCESKEFFLQKAIGWALRQYARTTPDWVRNFVAQHEKKLAPLSRREALKHLNKR